LTRMLFVDDQAPLLMARLRGLSQPPHGFVIDSVDEAAQALPAMRKRCPDVVLLDLRFPGDETRPESTGARLLREIVAEFPAVPVVDELPQQEFLIAWGQVKPQTGVLDRFEGAMPLFGEPLERPAQRFALRDDGFQHGDLPS